MTQEFKRETASICATILHTVLVSVAYPSYPTNNYVHLYKHDNSTQHNHYGRFREIKHNLGKKKLRRTKPTQHRRKRQSNYLKKWFFIKDKLIFPSIAQHLFEWPHGDFPVIKPKKSIPIVVHSVLQIRFKFIDKVQ